MYILFKLFLTVNIAPPRFQREVCKYTSNFELRQKKLLKMVKTEKPKLQY